MLREGEVLKNRYKVQGVIGRGGMSIVYMAVDTQLSNKIWAIKEVSRNARDQAGRPIEQSLATEADLLAKLDHPAIVDIVDIMKTDEYIYVIMDYVEGQSLDKVIREQGPQSEEDVQNWMLQVCDALDYLHNQNPPIIYRDMKPGNIMLRPDGYVKLIDLGVAREYKDASRKDTIAFGTEGYAPPEQYGKAQTDARADIYAVGATMWHLLSGEAPSEYPLPDVRSRNDQIGEGFAEVIIPKCTQLDRELRYQNCDALVNDLEIYEDLTKEYRDMQKRKVKLSGGFALGGIISAIIGVVLLLAGVVVTTSQCDNLITEGGICVQNNDLSGAEEAYVEAVSKPHNSNSGEAYTSLLNFYTDYNCPGNDGAITKSSSEEEVITDYELGRFTAAYKDGGSGATASESYIIALNIWENYGSINTEKSSPTADALEQASPYLDKAVTSSDPSEKSHAETLKSLAELSASSEGMVGENTPKEEFQKLQEMAEKASSVTRPKLKLAACHLIGNKLRFNLTEYRDAGISKSQVEALYSKYSQAVYSINITEPQRWVSLLESAQNTAALTQPLINNAYASN